MSDVDKPLQQSDLNAVSVFVNTNIRSRLFGPVFSGFPFNSQVLRFPPSDFTVNLIVHFPVLQYAP